MGADSVPNSRSLSTGPDPIDAALLFSPATANELPSKELCNQIMSACETWGFFNLTNHGFNQELMDSMTASMHHFFDLPLEEKKMVERTEANPMGYSNNELTKQKLDLKELFDFCYVPRPDLPADHTLNTTLDGNNRWPSISYPEFEPIVREYFLEATRCSFKLLQALCIGLGLDPNSLDHLFEDGIGFLRLNYYEPQQQLETSSAGANGNNNSTSNGGGQDNEEKQDELLLGIHPHSDAGFLTILLQDSVPGLQMLNNGTWHTVQPIPGAITINVGDMCQVITNDVVKAPVHRVVAPLIHKRYSAPFFFNPAAGATIAPLPRFTSYFNKAAVYRPINWGEFRSRRFAGDYADVGEEVQIAHYRVS